MRSFVVNTPVLDLRKEPRAALSSVMEEDPLQESQLLFAESLIGFEEHEGWLRVEAIEQPYCHPDGRWSGYPGWVRREGVVEVEEESLFSSASASSVVIENWSVLHVEDKTCDISLGTRLEVMGYCDGWAEVRLPDGGKGRVALHALCDQQEEPCLDRIVEVCKQFLGAPYFWGGRSAYHHRRRVSSSVDCSGLVNLAYRVVGCQVPRNAHDQFLAAQPVSVQELRSGDLVFLAKAKEECPDRIHHVMVYVDEETLIEATSEAGVCAVRLVSFVEKLGKPLGELDYGAHTREGVVFFGSLRGKLLQRALNGALHIS